MVMLKQFALTVAFLVLPLSAVAYVPDANFNLQPEWLQDYCVADRFSHIVVNGGVKCKNASHIKVTDFLFHGMNVSGNTSTNPSGNAITHVFVAQLPGLNGQGLSMARLDFAHGGLIAPHTHPHAGEVLVLLKGDLYVGFVNSTNNLFATTLTVGDVFMFPKGLVHFQLNVGNGTAKAISAFSSQNPGVLLMGPLLFGSNPPMKIEVLERAFGLSQFEVQHIEANFKT